MKINVFGLGYVGATTAACFAKLGHKVIGVDIDNAKVMEVSYGHSPVPVPGLDVLIAEQVGSGRLSATSNYRQGLLNADATFICVETPTKRNGDIDTSRLEVACRQVGENNHYMGSKRHAIVIRSTIFPGTYDRLREIIRKQTGPARIALNPEFLREKTAIEDFMKPPFVVIGVSSDNYNADTFDIVSRCYEGVDAPIIMTDPGVAQMIKYASNAWHACKVAYTNEVGDVCRRMGVDQDELMRLFCKDHTLNVSEYYHQVGGPYGGHCLPKDLSVLQYRGRKAGAKLPLINSISKSNKVKR